MYDAGKSVKEAALALGVCENTVYNLLNRGDLQRAPAAANGRRGRPETRVTTSSIVEFRQRRRSNYASVGNE